MTKDAEEKILRAVSLGLWPDRAAEMHGISSSSMRAHKKRHPRFATALKEAEAKAEAGIHGKILRHMDKQWTACAWMLERRWAERWAKKEPEVVANITTNTTVEAPTGPPLPADGDFAGYIAKLANAAAQIGLAGKAPEPDATGGT